MMIDPAFIDLTISSVTKTGAGRPGISAVVITMSCLTIVSANQSCLFAFKVIGHFFGVTACGFGLFHFVTFYHDKTCTRDWTCSLAAGRTSVAETIAPKRLAVAMV